MTAKCSVCDAQLYSDKGWKYEDQTTGVLFCGSEKCLPADKTNLLKLNALEAIDAGGIIQHTNTLMKQSFL
jgi:hypothetical protein